MVKRWIALIFILITAYSVKSQVFTNPRNLPLYDSRWIHWGFSFGVNKLDFILLRTQNFLFADSVDNLYGIEHKWIPGGHLGPIMEIKLSNYFKLRTLVILTFQQRTLNYYFNQGTDVVSITIPSTFIQTPILLKYHGARKTNLRPYIILGAAPTYDIAAKKRPVTEGPKVYLNTTDIVAEVGMGLEFFLPYFKLSTEIKFGRGFNNLLVPDNSVYTKYIKALYNNYFMFSLHFEG